MAKTIVLVHGRHFKPPEEALKALWLEALRWGIERDHPDKLDAYDAVRKDFVYYGDVSNEFLTEALGVTLRDDSRSRRETLDQLKSYSSRQFNKRLYDNLPGKDWTKEALADTFAGLLSAIRLSDLVIKSVAPDMREYWNLDSRFGSDVRFRMIDPLKGAMDREDDIMVISHSLGTMIAYDTFWKFCRLGEYRPTYTEKKIQMWLTLGSPLADETVKRHLKGARASAPWKYPDNILKWINVTAEDDYISHDQIVANDYREMKEHRLIRSITDKRIYNLAVRDGKSNPHHGVGYVIHPYVAGVVAKWV